MTSPSEASPGTRNGTARRAASPRPCPDLFDHQAAGYGLEIDRHYAQFLKFDLLRRLAEPEFVCLDIGSANGLLAIPLAGLVRRIHALDLSPGMLREGQKNLAAAGIRNVQLHRGDAANLGFKDASFDLVYAYSTLLLLPDPLAALKEASRVLKPRGLAVVDLAGKYNLSRLHWTRYYRRLGHLHLRYFDLPEARAVLEGLGLTVLEVHATGLLDQWRYVWGLRRLRPLDRLVHPDPRRPDPDYRASRRLPRWANRWYLVARKEGGPGL